MRSRGLLRGHTDARRFAPPDREGIVSKTELEGIPEGRDADDTDARPRQEAHLHEPAGHASTAVDRRDFALFSGAEVG